MNLNAPISISKKISLITLMLFMVMEIIIGTFFNSKFNQFATHYIASISEEQMKTTLSELSFYMERKTAISDLLSQSNTVKQYISRTKYLNTSQSLTTIDGYDSLMAELDLYLSKDPSIQSISIYLSARSQLLYNNGSHISEVNLSNPIYKWYQQALTSGEQAIYTDLYIDSLTGEYILSVQKAILDATGTSGVISVNFSLSSLKPSTEEQQFWILTDTHQIIGTSIDQITSPTSLKEVHPELMEAITEDRLASTIGNLVTLNQEITYKYSYLPSYNWYILLATSTKTLLEPFKQALMTGHLVVLFTIILVSAMVFVAISRFLKPLKSLKYGLSEISQGHFDTELESSLSDEIGASVSAYNTMRTSLIRVLKEISKITDTIHKSTSVLADDASKSSHAVDEIAMLIQEVAHDANVQVDETQNVLFLTNSISSKLDDTIFINQDLNTKSTILEEIMISARENLDVLIHQSAVIELALKVSLQILNSCFRYIDEMIALQDTMGTLLTELPPFENSDYHPSDLVDISERSQFLVKQLYTVFLDLEMALDEINHIIVETSSYEDDLLMHCDSAWDISQEIYNEIFTCSETLNVVSSRSISITKVMENIISLSQSTAIASEEVDSAIQNHTLAMKNIEHQITTLYKSSIRLSNELSNFRTEGKEN